MITSNKVVKWKKWRKQTGDEGSPESSIETCRQWFLTPGSTHGISFNTFQNPLFPWHSVATRSFKGRIFEAFQRLYASNMDYIIENLHVQYNIIYNHIIFVYSNSFHVSPKMTSDILPIIPHSSAFGCHFIWKEKVWHLPCLLLQFSIDFRERCHGIRRST